MVLTIYVAMSATFAYFMASVPWIPIDRHLLLTYFIATAILFVVDIHYVNAFRHVARAYFNLVLCGCFFVNRLSNNIVYLNLSTHFNVVDYNGFVAVCYR